MDVASYYSDEMDAAHSKFGRIAASFTACADATPHSLIRQGNTEEEKHRKPKKERRDFESIKLFRQIDVPRVEFSGVRVCTALTSIQPTFGSSSEISRNPGPSFVERSCASAPAARRSLPGGDGGGIGPQ